jgi:hypothetical protein
MIFIIIKNGAYSSPCHQWLVPTLAQAITGWYLVGPVPGTASLPLLLLPHLDLGEPCQMCWRHPHMVPHHQSIHASCFLQVLHHCCRQRPHTCHLALATSFTSHSLPQAAALSRSSQTAHQDLCQLRQCQLNTSSHHWIDFPSKAGTPTADITTMKCLLNSVIPTVDAQFMTINIENFHLNTLMAGMSTCTSPSKTSLTASCMEQYNLANLVPNG